MSSYYGIDTHRWRAYARELISSVLERYPTDSKARRKALKDAYPVKTRLWLSYEQWQTEVARQTNFTPASSGRGREIGSSMQGQSDLFTEADRLA